MANYFLDLSFSAAPMFWHILVLCLRLLLVSIFFLHVCLGICLSCILFSYFWSAVPSTSLSLSFSPSVHLSFFLRLCRSYVIIFSRTRWLSLLPRTCQRNAKTRSAEQSKHFNERGRIYLDRMSKQTDSVEERQTKRQADKKKIRREDRQTCRMSTESKKTNLKIRTEKKGSSLSERDRWIINCKM